MLVFKNEIQNTFINPIIRFFITFIFTFFCMKKQTIFQICASFVVYTIFYLIAVFLSNDWFCFNHLPLHELKARSFLVELFLDAILMQVFIYGFAVLFYDND